MEHFPNVCLKDYIGQWGYEFATYPTPKPSACLAYSIIKE